MRDRCRQLANCRHSCDVRQFPLRIAQRIFGPLAFDELAYLAAQSSHHVEQFLFGLPYVVAKKLHHPQDVATKQNGKSEGCVQSFACGDGGVGKIRIMNDIRNVCGLMPGPDPARQPDPEHESALAVTASNCGTFSFLYARPRRSVTDAPLGLATIARRGPIAGARTQSEVFLA